MTRVFESTAVLSVKGARSVRTTIPSAVCAILGVDPGDLVLWEVEPGSGRVSVSKKELPKSSKRR